MKEFKLGSFILHPQIKSEHHNAESKKLTNHDTSGTAATSSPTPSTGSPPPTSMTTATPPTSITGSY